MNQKHKKTVMTPQLAYWSVGLLFFLGVSYLCIRMIVLITGEEGERWRQIGRTLHRPEPIQLDPIRGSIYAADGRPVAITAPSYKLILDFRAGALALLHNDSLSMPKDSVKIAKRRALSQRLSQDLDLLASEYGKIAGIDMKANRERWRKAFQKQSRYCVVSHTDISYLDLQYLLSIAPFAPTYDKRGRIKEKSLLSRIYAREERSRRINPFGSLARRTIGSVYADKVDGLSQGKEGLEMKYDSLLRGTIGKGIKRYNAQRYNLNVLQAPKPGVNIHTTLDMNKQNMLEDVLRNQLIKLSAKRGSAVLMEVQTGKILAISNLQRKAEGQYTEVQNSAVSDMSEPGSTFKVASMVVALDDGVVSPTDTVDVGNGGWRVGRALVPDHNYGRGYGRISVAQTIEYSSNVGVAKIIVKHYGDRPDDYVQKVRDLCFGLDLHLEIPGAARPIVRKRSDNPNRWYGTTLAWMSFGYETSIPPIYTLAFFNAIANGGKLMRPYLVTRVTDAEGEVLEDIQPMVIKPEICKPSTLTAIQTMLRGVVTNGTGRSLKSDIVAISGKSGTAQIAQQGGYSGPEGKKHQVSFCGYFPSEAPRYSMIVVIREPSKDFAPGGGSMAGPVIRELAERLIAMETPLSLDSLPRTKQPLLSQSVTYGRKSELEPLLRQCSERYSPDPKISSDDYIRLGYDLQEHKLAVYPKGTMPAVVGMSATDAMYALLRRGYLPQMRGQGRVISQSIPAGSKAKFGTKVTIDLGV